MFSLTAVQPLRPPCRRAIACAARTSGTSSPSAPRARPETPASWEPLASGACARIAGSSARADRWPSRSLSRISSRSRPAPQRLSGIPSVPRARCPCALVAIQLIELIVAALVLHGRIVHGEDADEILGILGDG